MKLFAILLLVVAAFVATSFAHVTTWGSIRENSRSVLYQNVTAPAQLNRILEERVNFRAVILHSLF